MQHLADKGRLLVLHEEYSEHFERAFQQERFVFTRAPYSYGLHYNCNTFALNVLKRLTDLTLE
jgi:hypothetical protein